MRTTFSRRFSAEAFGGTFACLGWQVARVVELSDAGISPLVWWAADVTGECPRQDLQGRTPQRIGSTAEVVALGNGTKYFESAVFIGVPMGIDAPRFREDNVSSEDDEEPADLHDAVIEVRAFDSTYIFAFTSESDIAERLSRA